DTVRRWSNDLLHRDPGNPMPTRQGMESMVQLQAYFGEQMAERRKRPRGGRPAGGPWAHHAPFCSRRDEDSGELDRLEIREGDDRVRVLVIAPNQQLGECEEGDLNPSGLVKTSGFSRRNGRKRARTAKKWTSG